MRTFQSCWRFHGFDLSGPRQDYTDDAAVDAERTWRLTDSHTEILLADAWLRVRIHMTSSASSVRLSRSVWDTLSSKRLQVQKSSEVKPLEATVIINLGCQHNIRTRDSTKGFPEPRGGGAGTPDLFQPRNPGVLFHQTPEFQG